MANVAVPASRAQHKPGEVCPRCGVIHKTTQGADACVAHTTTGRGCRRSPIAGATVCLHHGGAAAQTKAKAGERQQEAEAVRLLEKYGVQFETDPLDALLQQVWEAAGNVNFLRERVRELESLATQTAFGPQLDYLVKLYNEERDRLTGFAAVCIKAGIAERQVRIAEQQGALVADLIRKVLDDPDLGLSTEQRQRGRQIGAKHLRLVS